MRHAGNAVIGRHIPETRHASIRLVAGFEEILLRFYVGAARIAHAVPEQDLASVPLERAKVGIIGVAEIEPLRGSKPGIYVLLARQVEVFQDIILLPEIGASQSVDYDITGTALLHIVRTGLWRPRRRRGPEES